MDEATLCKFKDKIISREQFELHTEKYLDMIRHGAVFVCPTDTIYGLSCDARNDAAVRRVRELKKRDAKPLSIWVPSKEWILQYSLVSTKYLKVLPGSVTLLVPLRDATPRDILSNYVLCGLNVAGLRIPNHWFSDVVSGLGFPLVTTSVNITGQPFATMISEIPYDILDGVDFIIDEGVKSGRPSTIINTVTGERIER